jgi:hypothetical protein
LSSNFNAPSSVSAAKELKSSPSILQPGYHQIGNSTDYLIGSFQTSWLEFPQSESGCASGNPLFSSLNVSCVPEYQISNHGPSYINGVFHRYSVGDGFSDTYADLAEYSVPQTAMVVGIDWSVIDETSQTVAVCQVILERSIHGVFKPSYSIISVPPDLLYLGGTGTVREWFLAIGHCIIVGLCSLFLLTAPFVWYKGYLSSVDFWPAIVLSILCIVSFGLQFSITANPPLIGANLGITQFVSLEWVASRFQSINQLNSVITAFLVAIVMLDLIGVSRLKRVGLIFSLFIISVLCLTILISLMYPSSVSFVDALVLLSRMQLGNVTNVDSVGLVGIGIIFCVIFWWFLGLAVGIFFAANEGGDIISGWIESMFPLPHVSESDTPIFSIPNPKGSIQADANEEEVLSALESVSAKVQAQLMVIRSELEGSLGEAVSQLASLEKP